MRSLNVALALTFTLLSLNSISQTTDDTFDWLVGKWEAKTKEGKFFEYWEKGKTYALEARGGELVKNDTVFKEWLTLTKIKDYWCYIPVVGKQQPIIFALKESAGYKFVFENKEHDFPQRITYEMIDPIHLNATVEGKVKGKVMKEVYNLERLK